jgi:hypothetical protein
MQAVYYMRIYAEYSNLAVNCLRKNVTNYKELGLTLMLFSITDLSCSFSEIFLHDIFSSRE